MTCIYVMAALAVFCGLFLWGWSRWIQIMNQLDEDMERMLKPEQERRDEG